MKVQFRKLLLIALAMPIMLGVFAGITRAQSSDQNLPTPVLANDINGRIAALDLGDSRSTRHFYAFEGNPGDLLITIDGKNLNGDIDVFTAVTFRPLTKTTLYANSLSGEVTKGIYLRAHQILILRVEARTPNDEEGSYHIRFGGSFAPFSGGIPVAENSKPQEDSARPNSGGRRLSSVGATIAQPTIETPPATAEAKTVENEKPADDTATANKTTPSSAVKGRPTRPAATARDSRRRTRPARPKPAPSDTEAAKTSGVRTEASQPESAKKEAGAAGEEKTTNSEKAEAAKSNPQELALPGAHLIIESRDGTKIDRPMSTVRRVVVEGGMIVIVLKTGRVERVAMSTVARMAIEP
ncbi:MAG: hypothetical protein QOH41_1467 [Blastocatellia bacterium]|jgi:hypothetical protein|nr:hypothetical protein [Blastocatellia bacterium]